MPRSRIFLLDVNVLLALASKRHAHWDGAARWFATVGYREAVICRVVQMGLLRLLTNRRVMGGDVQTMASAWELQDRMRADTRFWFVDEPADLERVWRRYTGAVEVSTNAWTDGYLLAFARCRDLCVVTFDRALGRFAEPEICVLDSP